MITAKMVYWITRLDGVKEMLAGMGVFLLVVLGLIALFFTIAILVEVEGFSKKFLYLWILPFIGSLFIIAGAFLPNTKEMCAILIIPKIANSEVTKELGNDALEIKKMALDYLKEKLEVKKESK